MRGRGKEYFEQIPEGRLTPGIMTIVRDFETKGEIKCFAVFEGRQDIVTFFVDLRELFGVEYECPREVTLVDMRSSEAPRCEPVRVDLYRSGDYPDFLAFMDYVLKDGEYDGCGAGMYYHAGYLEMAIYRGIASADDVLRCFIQQMDKEIEDTEKLVQSETVKYGRRNNSVKKSIECLETYLARRQRQEAGCGPIWNRDYEEMVQADIQRRKQRVEFK